MAGHSIEEAIQATARAIHYGVADVACRFDLVQDGFTPARADIIVRWALRMNQLKHHKKQSAPTPLKKKEVP